MNKNEIELLVMLAFGLVILMINLNDQVRFYFSYCKTRRWSIAVFLMLSLIGIKFPVIYYDMVSIIYTMYLFAVCKPIKRIFLAGINIMILALFYKYPIMIPHIIGMALLTVYFEYRVSKSDAIEDK